jgi:hypothetical protein
MIPMERPSVSVCPASNIAVDKTIRSLALADSIDSVKSGVPLGVPKNRDVSKE